MVSYTSSPPRPSCSIRTNTLNTGTFLPSAASSNDEEFGLSRELAAMQLAVSLEFREDLFGEHDSLMIFFSQ